MPTLSEHAKLANDLVVEGVYDNILTTSELAPFLQFKSFEGNAYVYNRENALPTSTTYAVGGSWEDTEATYSQKTATLRIIGLQSPLDRYVLQTRGNVQSQEAILFSGMAKSLGRKIDQFIVQGEPTSVTTEPQGLDNLIRGDTRMMAMDDGNIDGPGAAETELTLDRLDAMIDMIEDGKPDILMMNKTMRRKLTSLARADGSGVILTESNMFGHQYTIYDHVPIVINDWITNAEIYTSSGTWSSSTATTIFALKLGEEKQGFTIIHNGPVMTPDIQRIGIKEGANENLYRMVVYIEGIGYSAKMYAALGGIDSTA